VTTLLRRFGILIGTIFIVVLASGLSFGPEVEIEVGPPLMIAQGPLYEYPDLAITPDGSLWITYMGLVGSEEAVYLRPYRDGAFGDSLLIAQGTMAYRPRIAVAADGTVWVSWTQMSNGTPAVFVRPVRDSVPGEPVQVSGGGATAWRQEMVADSRGRLWLAWEETDGTAWWVMATVVENGVARRPRRVNETKARQMRPALIAGKRGEVWCAWDAYLGDYNYDIFLRRLDRQGPAVNLTRSPALEQSPALSVDRDGKLWIAWHSNAAANGAPDIPRWIDVRQWDGKRLRQPEAPMFGRDLSARESMQSFEFPTLLGDGNERLWVFGRPSQGFYAQVFLGDRWSALTSFGLEGWGGRGQMVTAVEAGDGSVWTARRDLDGIVLQRMTWKGEGARRPRLKEVEPNVAEGHAPGWRALRQTEVKVPGRQLYFGDIHQHSSLSDGTGTADDTYTRSRDLYGWDFAALADHEWFVRNRLMPSEWAYIKAVTASFNRPGEFVSIPAYEWTTARLPRGYGHKNVYFLDESTPIYSLADTIANTTPKLFSRLKADGAIAIPHHIGWTGVDWENHDPVVQPDVEIVSVHGAFEYLGNEPITHRGGMPGMFAQDGLARGLRFGLIGSSDGHGLIWHHGVGRKRDPWVQGLAGVWASELTREAIFEALKARRVYATSGSRIQLYFEGDGHPMGSEYRTQAAPTLRSQVVGTGKIRFVSLLRDNEVIYQYGGDAEGGRYGGFTFVDEGVEPGRHWYYLRVVQDDGEMAWSSPVWVEVGGSE
jgi:hypothetical protein